MTIHHHLQFTIFASIFGVIAGSHFRGMTINYIPLDRFGKVRICHKIAWKLETSEGRCDAAKVANQQEVGGQRFFKCDEIMATSGCPLPKDELGTMKYVCRNFDDNAPNGDNWSLGDNCFEETFDLQQTTKFYIKDGVPCCWVITASLDPAAMPDIEARLMMDLKIRPDLVASNKPIPINTSPEATLQPVVRTQAGCLFRLRITAIDEDGDTVRCRFAASYDECGGVCPDLQKVGAQMETDLCVITWTPTVADAGLHAAALMIEDYDNNNQLLSSVPLQFLITVFTSSETCSTPTVSPGDICITIQPGASLSLEITAMQSSDLPGNEIKEIVVVAKPDGLNEGQLTRVGNSDTWKVTVAWTPRSDQYRSHLLCYYATDMKDVQSPQQCVALKAGVSGVLPSIDTVSPVNFLPHPPQLTIVFSGPVSVPTSTKTISIIEFNSDVIVEVIDTSTSSNVVLNSDVMEASIVLTNSLFPNRRYYVLVDDGAFTAVEDCAGIRRPVDGISDKNVWTFVAEGPPDVDECADPVLNTCHQFADCSNTNPGFFCTCQSGFAGDGSSCVNINECTMKTHNCHIRADCIDTVGHFHCVCRVGFTGDGRVHCQDVDECVVNRNQNCHPTRANCVNTVGSFTCTCLPGYTGMPHVCLDINECALNLHNCHQYATCGNTEGSFVCNCAPGFLGNGVMCMNENECADPSTHTCREIVSMCVDTLGSFRCECTRGYTGDGLTCVDIDECATGQHGCNPNADCINTEGFFYCSCKQGFTGNGFVCIDVSNCTDIWPVVRDRYLIEDDHWRNVTSNCPTANLTSSPTMLDKPPIKQWQLIIDQYLHEFNEWIKIFGSGSSNDISLPNIDPNASPEEIWDVLRASHEQAQKAWQEEIGNPNDIMPHSSANCSDERRNQWVISLGTTQSVMDQYEETFGDVCDAV